MEHQQFRPHSLEEIKLSQFRLNPEINTGYGAAFGAVNSLRGYFADDLADNKAESGDKILGVISRTYPIIPDSLIERLEINSEASGIVRWGAQGILQPASSVSSSQHAG